MAQGTWVLQRTSSDRFPYRLQIIRGDQPWLILRAQDRWPAAGKNIFCLRETEAPDPDETLVEIERTSIIAFNERGRRMSIVLDRKRYKRCDFLFLSRSYKNKPGESYDVIFTAPDVDSQTTYKLYNRNYNKLTNAGSQEPGGMVTEVQIFPGTLPPQKEPNE